jgi:hypothetical protein
VLVSLVE